MTNEKDRELVEAVAMPWICVEEKPCEETVAVHWEELLTAITARLATVRKEETEAAFKEMIGIVASLPTQGTMNYRRGYEEGVRDALRTLEAAATEK